MKPPNKKRGLAVLLSIAALWLSASSQLYADGPAGAYVLRRNTLKQRIGGRGVVWAGVPDYGFEKDFYYLTGIRELEAVLLLVPGPGPDALFVPDTRDARRVREIAETSGVSVILPLAAFDRVFANLPAWDWSLYFPVPTDGDDPALEFLMRIRSRHSYLTVRDLAPFLREMRAVKSEAEIALMRKAVDITAAGLSAAMRAASPGLHEYDLQTIIEGTFRVLGAERTSFPSIIGSGPNSVIIHYQDNIRRMEAGELVVMDVGAEHAEYAGDLTRTVPVSGRFTARQRRIYGIVLEAQARAIAACRPGSTLRTVDTAARAVIEAKGYTFNHWTGHSLGLDVHDSLAPDVPLAPGMVVTVEPGIYIAAESLGVRIEDDVLITATGCEVLSAALPKDPALIERMAGFRTLRGRYAGTSSSSGRQAGSTMHRKRSGPPPAFSIH